ncbi:hypothetical protein E2C01_082498 [Portunus trituberculatus]|uniref:Uncharacterized protein n=1 Tax=Portunus trituberculatus TaxID=210409 RepID=A0A5B7J403_PORTR|nr:hypothetical protein [Portunus trituberculatus]
MVVHLITMRYSLLACVDYCPQGRKNRSSERCNEAKRKQSYPLVRPSSSQAETRLNGAAARAAVSASI